MTCGSRLGNRVSLWAESVVAWYRRLGRHKRRRSRITRRGTGFARPVGQDAFVVGWTPSAGEFMGDPAVAISAPLQHDSLDVFDQLLILIDTLTAQLVNIPGPAHIVQDTQATHRHRGMRDMRIRDHLVPFFKGYVANDFFRIEFSRAS